MAFDSSGDSSAMFGSKMESPPEEDLEDGEIASDEDGNAAEDKAEAEEEKPAQKPEPVTAQKPNKPSGQTPAEENDFARELQKLKEEVERKKDTRREQPKKRRENEERDKRRKRRPSDDNKSRKEKRRKVEGKPGEKNEEEDVDEDEMLGLCIRGASPTLNLDKVEVWSGKQPILDPHWQYEDNSENESDFDDRDDRKRRRREKERRGFKGNLREDRDIKKRLQMKRKGKNRKDMDNVDMICINFMKGNCNKGNDCFYSHAVCPPKKMELCKFYLMDCCAKRDKCLYLHDEFPCKFFHTGLKCYSGKKCKFSHDPLNSLSKDILLKHLETAPKEILGDFPRLSRDCAETMVNNKTTGKPADTSKIPSLFDIQVSIPPEFQGTGEKNEDRTTPPCSPPPNVKTSPKTKPKEGLKFYQDQETEANEGEGQTPEPMDFAKELEAYKNKQQQNKNGETNQKKPDAEKPQGFDAMTYFSNALSAGSASAKPEEEEKPHRRHRKHKEETGEDSSDKEDRRKRKHEEKHRKKARRKEGEEKEEHKKSRSRKQSKKEEKNNSPVRLTEDGTFGGIKFKIINRKEIRKSSDSDKEVLLPVKIEKPNEFLSSDDEKPLNYFVKKEKKERIEELDKFRLDIKTELEEETDENETENKLVIETNDDQEPEEEEKQEEPVVPKHLPRKQQELFLRIQTQQIQKVKEEQEKKKKEQETRERKSSVGSGTGSEAEVGRTPSPEPADENWYSSDDEDPAKKDSPLKMALQNLNSDKKSTLPEHPPEPSRSSTPPPPKPKIEITALNDLSKINITELLSSIRQVTSKSSSSASELKPAIVPPAASYEPPKVENPVKINFFNSEPEKKEIKDPRLRDPRTNSEAKHTTRRTSADDKTPYGKSIYDSANFKIETQDSDLRFQTKFDSDERVKNLDSIVPFGDVDLRTLGQSEQPEGDFDLRKFGLPFKPVPIHSAATEIDASLNSHPPINYKVETILIPRPDFSSIKISPNDPQVKKDPRLRRLFRINSSDGDSKEEAKKSGVPSDPRQRKHVIADTPKSPTESPFSPKQSEMGNNPNMLSTNLLLLAQLGLSAAAAGTTVFDPRLQQVLNKNPQELDMLRNQLSNIKSQTDFDMFRNQLMNNENPEMIRPQGQGLLPTPIPTQGMGILGPAPPFMMPGMGMPDPSVIMGPMGPMGQNPMGQNPMGPNPMGQNPMNFDPRFGGNQNDEDMNDTDIRHFNRGFRGDRRGRGSWRGNRDRNWDRDGRRHKREDRDRNRHNRDRDDRRKRSTTPD